MTPHVRLTNVTKSYGPATVLKGVSMDILPGEVHVLAGENGAGKSTLMKVLGGIVTDYDGNVEIGGENVRLRSPQDAARRGVSIIHQELSLVPTMSVMDNIFLGEMPTKGGFVQRGEMAEAARVALSKVGLDMPVETPMERLPIATQQLVEVAKALRHKGRVVVMDEPTSALNVQEAERLFGLIAELKEQGVGIVYISHKMDEIERLADRITVLRDGEWVATKPASELSVPELVRLMVGDKGLANQLTTESTEDIEKAASVNSVPSVVNDGAVALEVENVTIVQNGRKIVDGAGLSVRAGEVVGLAGLEGSGNSALLLGIFGAFGRISGTVKVEGKEVAIRNPKDAIRHRVALLTSDRKTTGLVLPMSITGNATLASLPSLSKGGWRSDKRELVIAEKAKKDLSIRAASLDLPVSALSGGNQQKVALAKWIETNPKVLLLDEPTRGIDINAKREIYALIEQWKAQGMAIVVITSELPELLLLADRILVMHRGHVVAEMARSEATADRVVHAAMNA
ncbi:sugar ABC transporter ATP-binding protein [bacterium]|nr:MAG: sugar ABC transporter ATP-binding protein [bacterium]